MLKQWHPEEIPEKEEISERLKEARAKLSEYQLKRPEM